jgi:hypothetical protein
MAMIETVNVRNENGHLLNAILKICKNYYADKDLPEYFINFYRQALSDERAVVCVIREGNEIAGYILGIPQDCGAMRYIRKADPHIAKDHDTYYVDTLEVLKGQKNPFGFVKLILELVKGVISKGKSKFSMYSRPHVSPKLLRVLKKRVSKKVGITRNITADWYGYPERYDFIELQLE